MSVEILDLLRKRDRMTVSEFAGALRVTATAVRQQLQRLLAEDLIDRVTARGGRGRPHHEYRLTEKGRRTGGNNFADLAVALWMELKDITVPEVRRGLLQRLATRLADSYRPSVQGSRPEQRIRQIGSLLEAREIPVQIREQGALPVIDALACPYPDLAERDRSICSLERMVFSELVGEPLRLSQCRLDGDGCCTFAAARSVAETDGDSTPNCPN